MPVDLAALHPEFAPKMHALMSGIAALHLPMRVFCGVRSIWEQDLLYAQGRSAEAICANQKWDMGYCMLVASKAAKGRVVTRAAGGQSPHNWGMAIDCVLTEPFRPWQTGGKADTVWGAYGELASGVGIEWGGDWEGLKDLPHVQLPGWRKYRPANWQKICAQAREDVLRRK